MRLFGEQTAGGRSKASPEPRWLSLLGNGPNTVSGSTVSNTQLSEFFGPHQVLGRELSEFLSAYYLCVKANSPSFSQNSPSLPQNSVRLSEFPSPKQYSRNSIPLPFPLFTAPEMTALGSACREQAVRCCHSACRPQHDCEGVSEVSRGSAAACDLDLRFRWPGTEQVFGPPDKKGKI